MPRRVMLETWIDPRYSYALVLPSGRRIPCEIVPRAYTMGRAWYPGLAPVKHGRFLAVPFYCLHEGSEVTGTWGRFVRTRIA